MLWFNPLKIAQPSQFLPKLPIGFFQRWLIGELGNNSRALGSLVHFLDVLWVSSHSASSRYTSVAGRPCNRRFVLFSSSWRANPPWYSVSTLVLLYSYLQYAMSAGRLLGQSTPSEFRLTHYPIKIRSDKPIQRGQDRSDSHWLPRHR